MFELCHKSVEIEVLIGFRNCFRQ